MKVIVISLFLLLISLSNINNNVQKSEYLYLFTRSTHLKSSYIAEDFNIKDTLSTHVGIGIKSKESLSIFHVIDNKKNNNSSLVKESKDQFINEYGITYYSIWRAKVSKQEHDLIVNTLNNYLRKKITFDKNFILSEDNNLYCSEFVYNIFKSLNSIKFDYKPINKELSPFYCKILKRDSLEYIPVDFFTELDIFEKQEDIFIKNYEN